MTTGLERMQRRSRQSHAPGDASYYHRTWVRRPNRDWGRHGLSVDCNVHSRIFQGLSLYHASVHFQRGSRRTGIRYRLRWVMAVLLPLPLLPSVEGRRAFSNWNDRERGWTIESKHTKDNHFGWRCSEARMTLTMSCLGGSSWGNIPSSGRHEASVARGLDREGIEFHRYGSDRGLAQ